MRIHKYILLVTVLVVALVSSSYAQDLLLEMKVKYPYLASPERKKMIAENYKKVSYGMTSAEVIKVLGKPDEIIKLYEPVIIEPKQIGYIYWYYIERRSPKKRINEKLVRVSFDMTYHVMNVAKWGFE